MASLHLEPFDPSNEFRCQAAFRAAGIAWGRGQSFDKTSVNIRVLRQLYECRKIGVAGQPQISKATTTPPKKPKPAPKPKTVKAPVDNRTDGQKINALVSKNNHAALTEMADGLKGLGKNPTKKQLAKAIVEAGNGAP